MEKWRIVADMSYEDRQVAIREFERFCAILKEKSYAKCWGGSGSNIYGVKGPSIERLTDEEIIALRKLL